ncbi:MAG: hypothetical protein K2L51_02095, partial [Clostridiales bacterium]|nr:hypothetical protein [Clostridiales bacterium]
MTTTEKLRNTPVQEGRKQNTLRNTLKCVLVLGVIAVVCVALLAVANRFLQPEVTLDRATSDMINEIAPTGADDATAFSSYIKMVDLGKSKYAVTDLDAYNKKYGSVNQKIRALYTSTHKDTGVVTFVVEAENKGRDAAIVVLTAYDADNKVSGIKIKSQAESYWARLANRKDVFDKFIGTSGTLTS